MKKKIDSRWLSSIWNSFPVTIFVDLLILLLLLEQNSGLPTKKIIFCWQITILYEKKSCLTSFKSSWGINRRI